MKRPVLGYVKDRDIVGVRNLTREEFIAFEKSYDEINKYMESGALFAVALLNHDDFSKALREHLSALRETQDVGKHNLDQVVLDLNRRILNYLCSVRTFLDHNETDISRSRGEPELKYFKDICANHYDNSFAYRFLYKLRNYVQHCGMPVGNLIIESEKDSKSKSGKKVIVSLVLDRDKLLSRFDGWNAQLKKELSALPPYFDVAPLLEEMMFRLGDIYFSLTEMLFPSVKSKAELIIQLVEEISVNECRVVIFDYVENTETSSQLTFKEIPLQQANWVLEDLEKLNP